MKVTVASVVFSGALEFLDDFMTSLQKQDCQEFDVLLMNDNIPINVLVSRLQKYKIFFTNRIHIVDKNSCKLLPYELRIELLYEVLANRTELLVLLDCDDVAESNRISEVMKQYDDKFDFYYNDIFLFNGMNAMPELPKITDNIDFLLEHNYLGLSNCTINMKHIKEEFIESLKEGVTRVFDWYLFSRMLLAGMAGKRIDNTGTYYRIYENNLAGIPQYTISELEKEKYVKLKHYNFLKKYDKRYSELIKTYESLDLCKCKTGTDISPHFWWGMLSEWRDR